MPHSRSQVESSFTQFATTIRDILAVDQDGKQVPDRRPRFQGFRLPEDFKINLGRALNHVKKNELDQAIRALGELQNHLGAIQGKYLKQYCIQIINEKRDELGQLGISQGSTHEDLRSIVDKKINEFQDFVEIRGKISLEHGSTLFWGTIDLIDATKTKLQQRIQEQQRAAAELKKIRQKAADDATQKRNTEAHRRELDESLNVGDRLETTTFAGII